MTTAADVIKLALKDIQVLDESEDPSAATMSDALDTLNQMLASWQLDSTYIYAQAETSFTPTGAESYTIDGAGADIVYARPDKINYAFYRLDDIDYPIEILNTWNEYSAISYKPVQSIPDVLYYNPKYSAGTIYIYPRPTTGTIYLNLDIEMPSYSTSADLIAIPAHYVMAIRYALAELLEVSMGRAKDPKIAQLAQKYIRIMKRHNLRINPLNIGSRKESDVTRITRGF
jgi:hypothetical protein